MGVSSCQNMTINVLLQLKCEKERVDALIGAANLGKSHCQLMEVDQVQEKKGGNPIEACFDLETPYYFFIFFLINICNIYI